MLLRNVVQGVATVMRMVWVERIDDAATPDSYSCSLLLRPLVILLLLLLLLLLTDTLPPPLGFFPLECRFACLSVWLLRWFGWLDLPD